MERRLRAILVAAGRIVARRWATASIVSFIAIGALILWAMWDFQALDARYVRLENAVTVEERDALAAAHHNAEFTYGLLLFSAFGTLFSVLGIGVIARTLHATREMTKTTQTASENTSRAYLHADVLHATRVGAAYILEVTVQNTGQTPARWFEISARGGGETPASLNALGVATANPPLVGRWHAIGALQSQTVHVPVNDFDWQSMFSQPQQGIVFAVYGTIRYADIYDREFVTDFAFWIRYIGGESANKFSKPLTKLRSYVETDVAC